MLSEVLFLLSMKYLFPEFMPSSVIATADKRCFIKTFSALQQHKNWDMQTSLGFFHIGGVLLFGLLEFFLQREIFTIVQKWFNTKKF